MLPTFALPSPRQVSVIHCSFQGKLLYTPDKFRRTLSCNKTSFTFHSLGPKIDEGIILTKLQYVRFEIEPPYANSKTSTHLPPTSKFTSSHARLCSWKLFHALDFGTGRLDVNHLSMTRRCAMTYSKISGIFVRQARRQSIIERDSPQVKPAMCWPP